MPYLLKSSALLATIVSAAVFGSGCRGNSGAPPQQAGGGPPAAVVEIVTLAARPIEQSSEFIATVQSRGSFTIQPDVEGIVSQILVKSGDRVAPGAVIAQIRPEKQQAAVRSTEANLGGTEADVQYWRQQVTRLESLMQAGAISRQELEQAQNSLRVAEARLASLDAQVHEQRVELEYYRVLAPQGGVVGDIPVRLGDRVTKATAITTIDSNQGLEAYLQVPLDRSADLRLGLPVQLLDTAGKVAATNPVTFVAPRVDEHTQTILVKSALSSVPPSLRIQQFVRARIIWRSAPGLTVPVTAVTRINGQYFCFVAEEGGRGGGLVAKQRPLDLGEISGNDYVVHAGLKAGDRLIVSGIQKIGDGAPVRPKA